MMVRKMRDRKFDVDEFLFSEFGIFIPDHLFHHPPCDLPLSISARQTAIMQYQAGQAILSVVNDIAYYSLEWRT